jgi:ADP-ribose pyrophosphatase YjhB (NUDIX family)
MYIHTVECITLDGHIKEFQSDRLILRPAAYALIVHEGKLLLLRMRQTGKYHLPGGGINIGERMEDTLKREVQEETGIDIEVVRFAHFEEVFFYYDPSDRAYHGLHFYFLCRPITFQLLTDDQVDDSSAEQPRWTEISGLLPEEFQYHGTQILELCRQVIT